MKLRIMMVTNNYTPYAGGVVSSIDIATQELQKLGHSVLIVSLDFLGKKHNDPSHVVRIPCAIKFMYKKNHIAVPFRAHKYMREIINNYQPHIIHSHHPALLGSVALKLARLYNVPCVFTYHTLYESYAHYLPLPQKIARYYIKKIVNAYCKKVTHVIVPTEPIKKLLCDRDIATSLSVIPTGLHPIYVSPYVERNRIENEPLRILHVGRFTQEKNVSFLIDVLARLHHNKIPFIATFIGYGFQEHYLKNYAYDHHGLSSNQVQFIHKPSKSVIAKFYKEADLFLFGSHSDTQGMVLAEAMAGGTPVLAVKGPGQEAIIEHGKNGFLANSLDEMVDYIQTIKNDPNLHKIMQKHAWETAQNYAPSRMGMKLASLYLNLLQSKLKKT